MNGDKIIKLILKPIELGFKESYTFSGRPYPADEKASEEIFN